MQCGREDTLEERYTIKSVREETQKRQSEEVIPQLDTEGIRPEHR